MKLEENTCFKDNAKSITRDSYKLIPPDKCCKTCRGDGTYPNYYCERYVKCIGRRGYEDKDE